MKITNYFVLVGMIFLSNCYHQYNRTSGDYQKLPLKVSEAPNKEGKACGTYAFPISLFYVFDNSTVEKARETAKISDIKSIETESNWGLFYPFLYLKRCTIVKGN